MTEINEALAEIELRAAEEITMLKGAEQAFIARGYPRPEIEEIVKERVTGRLLLKRFGPAVAMLVISLLGAMYISSVRVGVLMEITQLLLIERYQITLANIGSAGNTEAMRWFGMMAFEGVLAAVGFWKGQHSKSQNWSMTAYWVSLAVTIVAGILAGFTLTNNETVNFWFTVLFAILSGIGGPFAVAFTAENIGYVWQQMIDMDKVFEKEWQDKKKDKHSEWEKAEKSWSSEFEKYIPYYMNQVYGVERRKKLAKFDVGDVQPADSNEGNQVEVLRNYLRERGILPSQVGKGDDFRISAEQIVKDLNLQDKEKKNIHTHLTRLRRDEREGKFNL